MGLMEEKLKEVLVSTMPIILVVSVLTLSVLKLPAKEFGVFLLCVALVIVGFTVFLVGVDIGINPMGRAIGLEIPKRRSRIFMIVVIFLISFLVTVAEPDVSVFSAQVNALFSAINPNSLKYAIAVGVAAFLIIAAFRIIYKLSMRLILTISYIAVMAISIWLFTYGNPEFLGIAFDSGGVTTGPVTVPILLSLGLGICSVGAAKNGMEGFGMIGLASVGPILAVLVLGLSSADVTVSESVQSVSSIATIDFALLKEKFLESVLGVAQALIPLILFFIIFQKLLLGYSWNAVIRMVEGTVFAGMGVIIFLTGVYSGFMPVSAMLGDHLGSIVEEQWFLIIGLGLLLGFMVAFAEPAVSILSDQVEESSEGVLPKRIISLIIALGVAILVALGMAKLIFDLNFLYIIIPGYVITLILMWIGDKDMAGIAFDAGGVSTGPMSVAILSSIYVGLASAVYSGPEAVINGFGLIALIALAPCLFLSILGVYTKYRKSMGGYNG